MSRLRWRLPDRLPVPALSQVLALSAASQMLTARRCVKEIGTRGAWQVCKRNLSRRQLHLQQGCKERAQLYHQVFLSLLVLPSLLSS